MEGEDLVKMKIEYGKEITEKVISTEDKKGFSCYLNSIYSEPLYAKERAQHSKK